MDGKKKNKLFLILRIVISIALLGILVAFADVGKIAQSLSGFKPLALILVFGLIVLSVLLSAMKWGILLDAQANRIGLPALFKIYLTSLFFNNFLPSSVGGDAVRIYLAGKSCGKTASAAASVVTERVLATVSLSLLGLAGALLAQKASPLAVWLLGIILVAGLALAIILLSGWVPNPIRKKQGKIAKAWISFAGSAGELKKKPKAVLASFLLSFLFQITVALVVAAVMAGLGLPALALPDLFFVTSATSVLAMVPLGLNGYGLREGAYIFLLQPYGYAASSALIISILFAFFVSVFSLSGGINWALSHAKLRKPVVLKEENSL